MHAQRGLYGTEWGHQGSRGLSEWNALRSKIFYKGLGGGTVR
jgi:hypothetical protein